MLPLPLYQVVSRLLPEQCSGRTLHRRALAAAAAADHAEAERWFEAAATLYRGELAVEAMARLRVHQLMVRARAGGEPAPEALLEIVRRLNRLDRLESFDAPHELTDARSVLSAWLGEGRLPESADAGLTTSRAA